MSSSTLGIALLALTALVALTAVLWALGRRITARRIAARRISARRTAGSARLPGRAARPLPCDRSHAERVVTRDLQRSIRSETVVLLLR